jgi:hypothetical protein
MENTCIEIGTICKSQYIKKFVGFYTILLFFVLELFVLYKSGFFVFVFSADRTAQRRVESSLIVFFLFVGAKFEILVTLDAV